MDIINDFFTDPVENDDLLEIMDRFDTEKTLEVQNKLIWELGKANFLVPVDVKGNINDGVLEKNSEIFVKITADSNGNRYYAVFTDWANLRGFSRADENTIVLTYKQIRELFIKAKGKIRGVLINPYRYENDFLMTEKIMADIDERLAEMQEERKK